MPFHKGKGRKWSKKPGTSFDTSGTIMAPQAKKPRTKKPKKRTA